MSQRFSSITAAFTGQRAMILLLAAILAFVASTLILRLYRRAIVKSMRRRRQSDILELTGYLPPEPEHKPHDAPLSLKFITRESLEKNSPAATLRSPFVP